MRLVRRLLAVALFVALFVGVWRFAALNDAAISVHYLAGQTGEVPLSLALLLAFLLGVAGGIGVMLFETAKVGLLARRRRLEVARLEAEVHELRNLPLEGQPPAALYDDAPIAGPAEETAGRRV